MQKQITRSLGAMLLIIVTLGGCTTAQVIKKNSTPAIQAAAPTQLDELLDIGILQVDPNIPETLEEIDKELVVPDVRRAESSYISYLLKNTLELTGNWGAIRVTPEPSKSVDLELQGKILTSDGEQLRVLMRAIDARGDVWFERTYEDVASRFSYEITQEDPFQDLYNDIANDLLEAREQFSRGEILEIKAIANLKFARDLAPDAFDSYLTILKSGQLKIVQLPAEADSMMLRVARIKEQDYLFVDTLDEYYSRFFREMTPSYNEWRHATYDESIRLRKLQRQAKTRLLTGAGLIAAGVLVGSEGGSWATQAAGAGAVVGGIGAMKAGLNRRKDAEIQAESLRELSQSMAGEITPYVIRIEDRAIELTGTAQEQYVQWRKLLREIYKQETNIQSQ